MPDQELTNMNYTNRGVAGGGPAVATDPNAFVVSGAFRPQGLQLVKSPSGRITAIDLNSGDHVWMIPNGDTPEDVTNHPALKGMTIPKTGKPGSRAIGA